VITSPHNDNLTQVRKLAGRKWRDKLGEFVAEGEDLIAAAEAAGWPASMRLVAAGSGLEGMSYSQFMHGLREAGIELDRKVLADIAVRDPETFRRFAEKAREAVAA